MVEERKLKLIWKIGTHAAKKTVFMVPPLDCLRKKSYIKLHVEFNIALFSYVLFLSLKTSVACR